MGEFEKSLPTSWGWVDTGWQVTDVTTGEVYRVDNQQVWVVLKSAAGNLMTFEPFARIDHKRFQLRA